jgi:agmatinase
MVSVIGIPLDENSSFLKGPSLAPDKIREAFHSASSNYFTESEKCLNPSRDWVDEGNLTLTTGLEAIKQIESQANAILRKGSKLFSLGGDHSISYPLIEAVSNYYKPLTVLHIDAHPDLYHDFEGNPFSHASPFARALEGGHIQKLIQVGIRTMNTHQREQANRFGVDVIEMKHYRDDLSFHLDGFVYLSLDMDAIDPAFAPGVSHHEPGGLTSRQVIQLIQSLKANLVGADLVEYNPSRDQNGISAMLAAKLFKEILDKLL